MRPSSHENTKTRKAFLQRLFVVSWFRDVWPDRNEGAKDDPRLAGNAPWCDSDRVRVHARRGSAARASLDERSETADGRRGVQEHPGVEGHDGQRADGHDGRLFRGARHLLRGLPHRKRHRLGRVRGRPQPEEANRATDGRDDDRDQSRELRRATGRHLLHLPSRHRPSHRHAESDDALQRKDFGDTGRRDAVSECAFHRSSARQVHPGDRRRAASRESHQLCGKRHERRVRTGRRQASLRDLCEGSGSTDGHHPHPRRRQHHDVRRPQRLDRRAASSSSPSR